MVRFWAALRLPARGATPERQRTAKKKKKKKKREPSTLQKSRQTTPFILLSLQPATLPLLLNHARFYEPSKSFEWISLRHAAAQSFIAQHETLKGCRYKEKRSSLQLLNTEASLWEEKLHNELMQTHEWSQALDWWSISWKPRLFSEWKIRRLIGNFLISFLSQLRKLNWSGHIHSLELLISLSPLKER